MDEVELRCESHLHGVLSNDGLIEIKCRWKPCVDEVGVVVFHYFDPKTGDLVNTRKFRDPSSIVPTTSHALRRHR